MLDKKQRGSSAVKKVTAAGILSILAIAGCTTTETVYVEPDCIVPERGPLPQIEQKRLDDGWKLNGERISSDLYWTLMDRERVLADWAFAMRAELEGVCDGDS